MVRTQIQLTEEQAERLKRVAADRGTSMAAVIREAIDETVIGESPADRHAQALRVVGAFRSDASDVSENHDRYLAEIYGDD